jgi:hypothetical protein
MYCYTMLRRCHTARPYPLIKSLLTDEEIQTGAYYEVSCSSKESANKVSEAWFVSTWRCQLS